MTTLSVSDIVKRPSILDEVDDIVRVVNKKTNEIKGIFIGAKDLKQMERLIEELEYIKWRERNRGLMHSHENAGLCDIAAEELPGAYKA